MAPFAAIPASLERARAVSQEHSRPASRRAVYSRCSCRAELGAVAGEHQQILRREVGADAEPPQRRGEIERRAPEALPHVARRLQTVRARRRLERSVEILAEEPGAAGGRPGADAIGFEQHDLDRPRR